MASSCYVTMEKTNEYIQSNLNTFAIVGCKGIFHDENRKIPPVLGNDHHDASCGFCNISFWKSSRFCIHHRSAFKVKSVSWYIVEPVHGICFFIVRIWNDKFNLMDSLPQYEPQEDWISCHYRWIHWHYHIRIMTHFQHHIPSQQWHWNYSIKTVTSSVISRAQSLVKASQNGHGNSGPAVAYTMWLYRKITYDILLMQKVTG